nr:hypothetical protein OH826_07505 [Streptomyces sp. NBC_00899]WSX80224.1 hypothetical protein OH826_44005 [Streptomyces sp. NBC_00899]
MAGDIVNPDFAEPGIGSAPKRKLFTTKNGDGIPGWEVTQDAVQLVALPPEARPAGSGAGQALRLKGEEPEQVGAVDQTVPTTPGRKTTISWMESPDVSAQAEPIAAEQEYTVLVRPVETAEGAPGRKREVFAPAGTGGPDWHRRSVEFTPTGSNVTVEFSAGLPGALAPLITGFALTAGAAPPPRPATVHGKATGAPARAEPGGTVQLAFTVGNRAPEPVPGEKVTVTMRSQQPLALAAGSPGTVTFAGRQLAAGGPPEQGAFLVTVPPGTAPGTYQAVADLSCDGVPAADGTLTWQVEVPETAAPPADGHSPGTPLAGRAP